MKQHWVENITVFLSMLSCNVNKAEKFCQNSEHCDKTWRGTPHQLLPHMKLEMLVYRDYIAKQGCGKEFYVLM